MTNVDQRRPHEIVIVDETWMHCYEPARKAQYRLESQKEEARLKSQRKIDPRRRYSTGFFFFQLKRNRVSRKRREEEESLIRKYYIQKTTPKSISVWRSNSRLSPWFFFFFRVLFRTSFILCQKVGSLYLVRLQQPREQRYPFLSVRSVFPCVQTEIWLPNAWDI